MHNTEISRDKENNNSKQVSWDRRFQGAWSYFVLYRIWCCQRHFSISVYSSVLLFLYLYLYFVFTPKCFQTSSCSNYSLNEYQFVLKICSLIKNIVQMQMFHRVYLENLSICSLNTRLSLWFSFKKTSSKCALLNLL